MIAAIGTAKRAEINKAYNKKIKVINNEIDEIDRKREMYDPDKVREHRPEAYEREGYQINENDDPKTK